MLIILNMCVISVSAADNAVVGASPTGTLTSIPIATPTAIQTSPGATTQTPTAVATTTTEKKFRVGPTVKIRPVNDEIRKDQDGMIELYMDNPSLNDVTLTVDAHISVPSGLHVYGQGFGEAGAAGTVYGVFEVPPGKARTIYITIKSEKIGDFSAQFSGTYYPDSNKDAYQPISLTHPFKVLEASAKPNEPSSASPTDQKEQATTTKSPGISIVVTIFVITILGYILRRR
jgi:hypothetical protein